MNLNAAKVCKLSCSTSQTALLDCDINTHTSNKQIGDFLWVPKSEHSIDIVELQWST